MVLPETDRLFAGIRFICWDQVYVCVAKRRCEDMIFCLF